MRFGAIPRAIPVPTGNKCPLIAKRAQSLAGSPNNIMYRLLHNHLHLRYIGEKQFSMPHQEVSSGLIRAWQCLFRPVAQHPCCGPQTRPSHSITVHRCPQLPRTASYAASCHSSHGPVRCAVRTSRFPSVPCFPGAGRGTCIIAHQATPPCCFGHLLLRLRLKGV